MSKELSDENSRKFPSFFLSNKFFQNAISRKVSDTLLSFLLRVTRGAHNSNLEVPVVLKVERYPPDKSLSTG